MEEAQESCQRGEAEASRQRRSPTEGPGVGVRGHGDRAPSSVRGDGLREETRERGRIESGRSVPGGARGTGGRERDGIGLGLARGEAGP